ncbi:hypothetical protein HZB01_04395 [Candidatus Woesearchaeota archaeon]|nr:hypothetical protein [Candidatus Woesearchaeota archaeon]
MARTLQLTALFMILLVVMLPVSLASLQWNTAEIQTPLNAARDTDPPILTHNPIPSIINSTSLLINGSVDEQSTINFYVIHDGSNPFEVPATVTNLSGEFRDNRILLIWNAANKSNRYLVYRNHINGTGPLTSTTAPSYQDQEVKAGTSYTYQVSGLSSQCTEGEKSEDITLQVPSNASVNGTIPHAYNLTGDCTKRGTASIEANNTFSYVLSLQEGQNNVTIEAIDGSNNVVRETYSVIADTSAPEIIEPKNIEQQYSPSYVPLLKIKGTVRDRGRDFISAKVIVALNGANATIVDTDSEGKFSADVVLEQRIIAEQDQTQQVLITGTAWTNNITLTAVDDAGHMSTPVFGRIVYTQCGYGSWWLINTTQPNPPILTPRLIAKGIAQINLGVDLSWAAGPGFNQILKGNPKVKFLPLSEEAQKNFDVEWMQSPLTRWTAVRSRNGSDEGVRRGYIQLNFKPVNPSPPGSNWTVFKQEENISNHRQGECLAQPGFGCVRLPLMMEIDFSSDYYASNYYNNTPYGNTYNTNTYNNNPYNTGLEDYNHVQKSCMLVEVPIDRRINPNVIPSRFLNQSIEFIGDTIKLINDILKPLNTVKTTLFWGCMGTWVWQWVVTFQEKWSCNFTAGVDAKMRDAASVGMCDNAYTTDNDKQQGCKTCQEAIAKKKSWITKMQYVCDRTWCPSALTLGEHIRQAQRLDPVRKVAGLQTTDGKEVYSGSDCAFGEKTNAPSYSKISTAYSTDSDTGTKGIKEVYEDYKGGTPEKCKGPHPADPECCGYEYMQQWGSSCLLMNEIKQSKCLAAQDSNRMADDDNSECTGIGAIWNAAAGFCEAGGKPVAELVHTNCQYRPDNHPEGANTVRPSIENQVWYRISYANDQKTVVLERGYLTQNVELAGGELGTDTDLLGKDSTVGTEMVFKPMGDSTNLFDLTEEEYTKDRNKVPSAFQSDFEQNLRGKITCPQQQDRAQKVDSMWKIVNQKIGVSDRKYVVDPTSSILRTVQCGCLPGLTSYLTLYRNALQAVQGCLQSIYTTGDGDPGLCHQVLSVYVCDMMWDAIRCFMQKYGAGPGKRSSGGLGDLFGAFSATTFDVEKNVRSRYGSNQMFKAMFDERQLLHSMCLFAFTGRWTFNPAAILEQDFAVPIKSVAVMGPCKRKFIGYDLSTNPPGLSTFNYHLGFGIAAGADLTYNIRLECSDDFSCSDDPVSYPDGRCDCRNGKQGVVVNVAQALSTRTNPTPQQNNPEGLSTYRGGFSGGNGVPAGGTVSAEIDQEMAATRWRYDKATLEYTYRDKDGKSVTEQTSCHIGTDGATPYAFCQFDAGTLSYRCDAGTQAESWIRFTGRPVPTKPLYAPQDRATFNVEVEQQVPEDSSYAHQSCTGQCEFTKYLDVAIINSRGQTVWNTDGSGTKRWYQLNQEGVYTVQFPTDYTVKKEDFGKVSTTPECRVLGGSAFTTCTGNTQGMWIGLVGTDATIKYQQKTYTNQESPQKTNFNSGTPCITCPTNRVGQPCSCGGISFTITQPFVVENPVYVVSTTPSVQSENPCYTNPDAELPWTAKFTLYDAEDDGSGNYRKSATKSYYVGEPQETAVEFMVKCSSVTGQTDKQQNACTSEQPLSNCFCGSAGTACGPDASAGQYCCQQTKCSQTACCPSNGETNATALCTCGNATSTCNIGDFCYQIDGKWGCYPTPKPIPITGASS